MNKNVEEQLAKVRANLQEELKDTPTVEERTEAIKWLGYEWDPILKFLRYLDQSTEVVVPDEVRADYQNQLFHVKLEAVKKKKNVEETGLIKPIR